MAVDTMLPSFDPPSGGAIRGGSYDGNRRIVSAAQNHVPEEARKIVTVLFTDVASSTLLGQQLDPESFRRVMTRYFQEMK
jgi:class 3 adenylate cyclase